MDEIVIKTDDQGLIRDCCYLCHSLIQLIKQICLSLIFLKQKVKGDVTAVQYSMFKKLLS